MKKGDKEVNWDKVERWLKRINKGWKGKYYKKAIYLQQEQRRFKSTGKYSQ